VPLGFSLSDFFQSKRDEIIAVWIRRLKTDVGRQYAARPVEELMYTVSSAYDAEVDVILRGDFRKINTFINKITQMRLEAGFMLSDVQKAFELFRELATERLVKETTLSEFSDTVVRMNDCLSYTIHRFSDYFQSMHEKKILEHNRLLEQEVRTRTAELRESERKYKMLVEEINDGYFVVQDQIIVFANQAFCRMHDFRLEEIIGCRFLDFVSPDDRERVMDLYQKGLDKWARSRMFEYLRYTRTHEKYPTEILSKLIEYDHRLSSIGICRDITERVHLEQKMRESERMAYIGHITTSLSHELRNPLSAIKMNLQILKKNSQIKGNDHRRIDISVQEVDRLEGILQELLDFAKPLQIKNGQSQINRILTDALELLDMKFVEAGMDIIIDLDPNLPEILADEEKLGQAFINILLNALEASARGSKIEIQSAFDTRNGSCARIVIADEGQGVAEQHIGDIFKPFFTTKSSGTGLGLSNAQRIIEAHGGRIDVENRHPSGAFFRINLPVKTV
jgi:PAS domain S-box-containing protein